MMRYLGLALILALLLCGCTQETATPTSTGDVLGNTVTSTQDAVVYVPESPAEQATDGGVYSYALRDSGYYGCTIYEGSLMLFRQREEATELTVFNEDLTKIVYTINLGVGSVHPQAQMQISEQGMVYCDSVNRILVFLNTMMVETGRMYLPENLQGDAWVSPDWKNAYFCTDEGICTMDLQTGFSHVLLQQSAHSQQITGIFGNGAALRYEAEVTEGKKQIFLIDAESGGILREDGDMVTLSTSGENYFFAQNVSGVRSLRFGAGEEHKALWPLEDTAQPVMLFEDNALVMVQSSETQTEFACYDLTTGKRTAEVQLPDVLRVWGLAEGQEKQLWFFGEDTEGQTMLYCWDIAKSMTEDETVYTAPWYTLEEPDTDGLDQIQKKADKLGEKFGVEILIWEDAAKTAPKNQSFTQEHMTQLYAHYLPKIEQVLGTFPKGLFTKASTGTLQIALLHEITGNPDKGTLAETDCMQFWKGNTPVVAITFGEDFERNLYHGVYLYMEARILSKSSALYEWHKYNPSAFDYDNDYIENLKRTDTTYLTGKKPYFIDLFSMSYAREDRATIFEYACMPGNEEIFQSSAIQKKLQRICKGIREAYGLKKVETEFLWEQYLK